MALSRYSAGMNRIVLFLFVLMNLLRGEDGNVLGKAEEESYGGKIVRITVGEKDLSIGQSFKFWERTLDRAEAEGAKAVIFDLDTPGGLAFPTGEMMSQIANLKMPTVAFVNPKALSAGSMIAISTDRIYMTPGSTIGSSAIVNGTGQEIEKVMREKLESFFNAHVRYIAEKKGHRKEVIQAMMFLNDEDQSFGDLVVKKGKLLNLNSSDAVKLLDDGPILAEAELEDLDAVLEAEGWSRADLVDAKPSAFEKLAWWVASVSPILILLGLAGGYFEFKAPGFGVGGVISIIAFSLFFFGNYLAGNMAGYELAAIFVLGLILIAVEIFVLPGFGVPGIFGLIIAVGSLVFSMIDGVKWRQYEWGSGSLLDAISGPAMYLAIGIFGWVGLLYLMFRFVPGIPFLNRTLLNASLAEGTGMETREGEASRVGMTGEAQTDLHPSGKAEIDGEIVDVVVEGGFARKGDAVRIIKEDGMGIVVKTV